MYSHVLHFAFPPLQILLRKGGIKDPTFKPQAKNFLLFPTVFHTEEPLLKAGVAQRYQQVRHGPLIDWYYAAAAIALFHCFVNWPIADSNSYLEVRTREMLSNLYPAPHSTTDIPESFAT